MGKRVLQLAGEQPGEGCLRVSLMDGHIAVLALNRPSARNALDVDLVDRLAEAVKVVEEDPAVTVAILTGSDTVFCAGADLREVAAGRLNRLFTRDGGLAGFSHADRQKPWIAAVEGAALAGGFELALGCDMIVASTQALFGLPEVKRGLIASAGGIYRLPRCLQRAVALEMIATGEPISAERASGLGLVNRLAPAGEALKAALELARTIHRNAPLAVRESLVIARLAFDRYEAELSELCDDAQARLQATHDYLEGSTAFVEKRAPRWQGK